MSETLGVNQSKFVAAEREADFLTESDIANKANKIPAADYPNPIFRGTYDDEASIPEPPEVPDDHPYQEGDIVVLTNPGTEFQYQSEAWVDTANPPGTTAEILSTPPKDLSDIASSIPSSGHLVVDTTFENEDEQQTPLASVVQKTTKWSIDDKSITAESKTLPNADESHAGCATPDLVNDVSDAKTGLNAHILNTSNPHNVTAQQVFDLQNTQDVVAQANIYQGEASPENRLVTAAEVQSAMQGVPSQMSNLEFGADTVATMQTITVMEEGDKCRVQEVQTTYIYTDGEWVEQDDSSDAVRQFRDIESWYGVWKQAIHNGEVTARITCESVNPSIWNLLVYSDVLVDGEVTDAKIGTRELVEATGTTEIVPVEAKTYTGWLQAIRNNLKGLFNLFSDHADDTDIHTNTIEKSVWNNKQNALTLPLSIAQGGTGQTTKSAAIQSLFSNRVPDKDNAALLMSGAAAGNTGWETPQEVANVLEPKIGFVSRNNSTSNAIQNVILNDTFSGSASLCMPIRVSTTIQALITLTGNIGRTSSAASSSYGAEFTMAINTIGNSVCMTFINTGEVSIEVTANAMTVIRYTDATGDPNCFAVRYTGSYMDFVLQTVSIWQPIVKSRTANIPLPSEYTTLTKTQRII